MFPALKYQFVRSYEATRTSRRNRSLVRHFLTLSDAILVNPTGGGGGGGGGLLMRSCMAHQTNTPALAAEIQHIQLCDFHTGRLWRDHIAIKHKTSAARVAQLLQPSLAFCFSLQSMTVRRHWLYRHWLQAKTKC